MDIESILRATPSGRGTGKPLRPWNVNSVNCSHFIDRPHDSNDN